MELEYPKAAFPTAWVVAMCAAGIGTDVASMTGWTVLASLTLIPPLVMLHWLNQPRQRRAECIRQVLR
jgi:hypothetical protein